MKRIALIGRSGSGKSTLLRELDADGLKLPIITEGARDILTRHPELSPHHKQLRMMYQQYIEEDIAIKRYHGFISDRGLHDYIVFSRALGLDIPFYEKQLNNRYDIVFRLQCNKPFIQDGVRVEKDQLSADETQKQIEDLYKRTGHRFVEVPIADISTQCKFIKRFLR